jgi:hypothetical protein
VNGAPKLQEVGEIKNCVTGARSKWQLRSRLEFLTLKSIDQKSFIEKDGQCKIPLRLGALARKK